MLMYKSDENENKKTKKDSNLKNSSKKTSKSSLIGIIPLNFKDNLNSDEDFETETESGNLNLNDIVDILESDYTEVIDEDKEIKNDEILNYDKKENLPDKDDLSPEIDNVKNNQYRKNIKKNSSKSKNYLPSKNKDRKHFENLNEIIITLKKDYMNLNQIFDSFQKSDFSSMDDSKCNKILNMLEEQVFLKFKSFNNINKLANSNEHLRNTLSLIFKSEDITSQCIMYAYKIYSLIKMFHYDKDHLHKNYLKKPRSSFFLGGDNINNTKNNFKKKQFDSLKFARDEQIKIFDLKTSDELSTEDQANLNTLKNHRLIMEGYKSNLRIDTIEKDRVKDLTLDIRNSKKFLSSFFFNSSIISLDYLKQLTQSEIKLIKMYRNSKK